MKKILYILSFMPVLALAQTQDQNYIKTTSYKAENSGNPQVHVTYLDGLGRPIQQIAHQQSNSGKDIVTHIEYDVYGRQLKEFLPYVNQAASLNYNSGASTDVLGFYNQPYYEDTQNPFSEKKLEASPLDRMLRHAAPGTSWILNQNGGPDKSIKFEYQTNIENEVNLYKANSIWNQGEGLYESTGLIQGNFYTPNRLYKTVTKDENWTGFSGKNNTTEEFKDKDGRVVLKRTYKSGASYDTYYVYDQYGNLTYVIPPLVNTQQTITLEMLKGLCYQYKYDYRNRLVAKKLPGKQWEFMVYDRVNRVVATGPAYNPYGATSETDSGWLITEYDVFGRITQTGWKAMTVSSSERRSTQSSINSGNNVFALVETDILTKNYYDNYNYAGVPDPIPSTIEGQELANNVRGLATGTWVRILDTPGSSASETSYTLYDYKYRPIRTFISNYLGGYTQTDTKFDWSGKTMYTIVRHKYNSSASEVIVKDMFEYTAQDRLSLHKQKINQFAEQLIVKNTYDELGQLKSKNVGGLDTSGAIGLQKVDYNYNIRGWLTGINNEQGYNEDGILLGSGDLFGFKINYDKLEGETIPNVVKLFNGNIAETLWKASSDNQLRKYSYRYDNLNRLLKATYQKPESQFSISNSYNEELDYDKNGNIQFLKRNGDNDTDIESTGALEIDDLIYSYDPDSPNRLLKVVDHSRSQGFKDDSDGLNDPDNDYTYDLNGNMIRDDNKGIKEIFYNHLNLPTNINFDEVARNITYIYDATGKKIKKMVNFGAPLYTVANTDYLQGFQYVNGRLQYFPHAEGYVNVTFEGGFGGEIVYYNYVYNYTDHLGNIRLSYGADPSNLGVIKIIEENHYYPFGLKHTNYNSDWLLFQKVSDEELVLRRPLPTAPQTPIYKYKYNGKEWQDELGLNFYDYGARNYDPAIGRWMNIDPLAEKYFSITPYSYVANMPTIAVDPDGNDIIFVVRGDNGKSQSFTYSKGNFYHSNGKRYDPGKEGISKTMYKVLSSFRAIEKSDDKELKGMLKTLETSKQKHYMEEGRVNEVTGDPNSMSVESEKVKSGTPVDTQTTLNLSEEKKKKFEEIEGVPASDLSTVSHELRHQYDYDQGKMADSEGVPSSSNDPAEKRAVGTENKARKIEGIPRRDKYSGKKIETD